MALAPGNHFKADLRAIRFTLWDHLGAERLFKLEPFAHLSREECDAVIDQAYRFATEVTGPLNSSGDRTGCHMEGGRVVTPPGFREAWRKLFEVGLMPFTIPAESGGFGGPSAVGVVLQELQSGANTAFQMYPGLTHGAADLMEHFALDEDRKRFLPAMLDGRYSGTMCLSEPHAGSDVGRHPHARASPGGQRLRDHRDQVLDLGGRPRSDREHRAPGAGPHRGRADGHQGAVALHRAEDLGQRGRQPGRAQRRHHRAPSSTSSASAASATAVLNFGESGAAGASWWAAGPHEGMRQMFRMMNGARIAVGVQGIAVGLDRLPQRAGVRARAASRARRSGTSRTPTRRGCRSSSTPTSAACCWR